MRDPIWMYFLVIDPDGVVVEATADKDAALATAGAHDRKCHVYRVDKWTRVWPDAPVSESERATSIGVESDPAEDAYWTGSEPGGGAGLL